MFDPDKNEDRPQDVREPDAYQEYERRYGGKEANEHIRNGEVSDKQKVLPHQFTFSETLVSQNINLFPSIAGCFRVFAGLTWD